MTTWKRIGCRLPLVLLLLVCLVVGQPADCRAQGGPPVFTIQPQSQNASVGSSITFTTAVSSITFATYQWKFNGTNIAGATSTNYAIASVQLTNAGNYSVGVTNSVGGVLSTNAVLSVASPPVITNQPASVNRVETGNVTFAVGASGGALTYQWRFNGTNIAGATNSSFQLLNLQAWQAGPYSVMVSNNVGSAATSNAVLTIVYPAGTVACWRYDADGESTVLPGQSGGMKAIAGGSVHTMALTTNGTVVVWGDNTYGETNVPAGLSNVVSISAGAYHCMALKSNGTVVVWGSNAYGQTNVPPGLNNVISIAAGAHHCLALRADGTVVAWGYNVDGETNVPPSLTNVVLITAGLFHNLAMTTTGTIVGWGNATNGATVPPAGLSGVASLAAGNAFSLALKNNGTIVVWGDNTYGQTNVPAGLGNTMAIAAGAYHCVALKANGTVAAWGQDTYGQTNVPTGFATIAGVAAGWFHSIVLKGSGAPVITAQPLSMQVTNGSNATFAVLAVGIAPLKYQWFGGTNQIPGATNSTLTLTNVQAWQAGPYSVEVTNATGGVTEPAFSLNAFLNISLLPGSVVAWNDNTDGESVVPATLGTNAVAISAGLFDGSAARSDGTVTAWGTAPVTPPGLSNIVAVGAGGYHTIGLKNNGTVVAWGDNTFGQTNVPVGLSNVIAISVGRYHNMALKSDGTVAVWGDDSAGETNVPPGLSNVVAVSAGAYFCLALRSDGSIVGWGDNNDGQITIPTTLSNVVAIAAGGFHSLALQGDGTMAAWGYNSSGQATVPLGLPKIAAIAAGGLHDLALGNDGSIFVWGDNSSGQTNLPPALVPAKAVAIAGGQMHSVVRLGVGTIVIVTQPVSQNAYFGLPVSFGVMAIGPTTLSYQWRFNGTNIVGATNATYTLASPQTNNIGIYSVVVTHSNLSATSANATLNLSEAPTLLSSADYTLGGFQFTLSGQVGTYVILSSTNLVKWTPLSTNATGPAGILTFTDTKASKFMRRFYRAELQ
ncbi:MAG TPA: immunoglobulin domain-containing protein [Verrucomicrobiae bacterium]|nr:immunoglobulin domain-containing protein [Verrucomicrobiae bacterium]